MQWLIHGSSIFSTLASSKELFFEYKCQELRLDTVRDIVKVAYPASKPAGCSSMDAVIEPNYHKGTYFCRQIFDEKSKAITKLPIETIETMRAHQSGERACIYCDRALKLKEEFTDVFSSPNDEMGPHIKSKGIDYNVHDCVYIYDAKSTVLVLGQIRHIHIPQNRSKNLEEVRNLKTENIEVDIFRRYDELLPLCSMEPQGAFTKRDERRLYYTGKSKMINVTELEGKCNIQAWPNFPGRQDLNDFKDESNDNFWVADEVS